MRLSEFLHDHCIACGGNWTQMLMTGIQKLWPESLDKYPDDHEFEFVEVMRILKAHKVDLESATLEHKEF